MQMLNSNSITLQINLSPGDIDYARLTVTALINQHTEVDQILIIVDLCRPSKTKLVNPEIRFPEPIYSNKKTEIVKIANEIAKNHSNCNVYILESDDPIIKLLGDKYLGGWYYNTHDYGGCANMSYWLGFDIPTTKYVVHYDGDILLHQKPGYFWTREAQRLLENNHDVIAACPRYTTPFIFSDKSPSPKHGVNFEKRNECFVDSWFSTRCLMIDKERFESFLPLLTGKTLIESLFVQYFNRGFPRSPEILMHRKIGGNKGKRLILENFHSWIMHPHSKPLQYLKNIEEIISNVHKGNYPEGHLMEDFELEKWIKMISK